MSKIERVKLARATKLVKQHETSSVGAIATKLGTAAVERNDLEARWGIARMTYHVPMLGHTFFQNDKCSFTLPFVLPPLQQNWDANAGRSVMPQILVLDELGVSFDTRREAAAIICEDPTTDPDTNAGKLSYDDVGDYDIHFKISEKQQQFFGATGVVPDAELVSLHLVPEQFSGRPFRDNPFLLTGIAKQLQGYRTYVIDVAMKQTTNKTGLVSLCISAKFRVPLGPRYLSEQNAPTPDNPSAPYVPFTTPVGNTPITDAVQTNLESVDARFRKRLEGGATTEGIRPPEGVLVDVGSYEIMCVPMWGNFNQNLGGVSKRVLNYAAIAAHQNPPFYRGTASATVPDPQPWTYDRRVIPLVQPWTLHHVIVCKNRMDPTSVLYSRAPQSATFYDKIQVWLTPGPRSDNPNSQLIAEGDRLAGTFTLIDQLKNRPDGMNCGAYTALSPSDWDVYAMPLVGAGGVGYCPQGRPIFMGRTNTGGADRTQLNGALPTLLGQETEIAVQWDIGNTSGQLDAGDEDPNATFVGYGGHWVLLIGQKNLTGAFGDVPT